MKLKWKDVYNKCNHIENCQVTNILRTYTINSNIKNFMKNYGIATLIIVIAILAILCFTFRTNLQIVLYCIILFVLLFLFSVIYATYKISLKEDGIVARVNFQDTNIPYNKLANIYISKEKKRIFFIPFHYYVINIIYVLDEENLNILSFPTIMLNKNEVINFFKSFETQEFEVPNKEQKKK